MSLEKVVRELEKMKSVKAAILFGSHAKGKQRKDSDVDICVITEGGDEALAVSSEKYDISLFGELPLAIRYRVFRHGRVLFVKDRKLLTRLKYWTVKHYLDEKHWRDRAVEKVLS